VYDASAGMWAVVPGTYRLAVGDSSVDAALCSFVLVRTAVPYRQAKEVMDLMLPTSGRDSHLTIRNHTIAIGASIQHAVSARRHRHGE
jgi:hypothetical protein